MKVYLIFRFIVAIIGFILIFVWLYRDTKALKELKNK